MMAAEEDVINIVDACIPSSVSEECGIDLLIDIFDAVDNIIESIPTMYPHPEKRNIGRYIIFKKDKFGFFHPKITSRVKLLNKKLFTKRSIETHRTFIKDPKIAGKYNVYVMDKVIY